MTRHISRFVAGAFSVLFVALATAYLLKVAQPEKSSPVPQSLPKNVNQQLSGYTFTRSERGRQIFTVHAARTVALKEGGKTLLEDVAVEVFGRMGNRHDSLKTRRCDYEPDSGDLSCMGKVVIQLNASGDRGPGSGLKGRHTLRLETSKISYKPRESLVVSDAPVEFLYGPASGSAVGLRYDTADGWMELKSDVVLNLPSLGGSASPLRVAASGLSFENGEGQVQLRGPLEVTQGTRRVLASSSTIFLDQQNRITAATLEGGAQGFDSSPNNALEVKAQTVKADFDVSSSQLRTLWADGNVEVESRGVDVAGSETSFNRLTAQHLEVSFIGEGSEAAEPRAATALGDVKISAQARPALRSADSPSAPSKDAGRPSAERHELAASQVQFEFYPRGQALREAKTIGPGELVVTPADPKQGKRVVTAGQFVMKFDERNHLQSLRGLSQTKVVVEPAAKRPPAEPEESWSDELEANFNPATQELATLEQAGNFHFRQGDRQATADRASYTSQDRVLKLAGSPQLWDPEARMGAERFRIDLDSGTAEGLSRVESTHFGQAVGSPSAARPGATADHAQNGIDLSDTINVLADRVVAERESQTLHYEGHVRAWSGYDVIESPSLDIYRQQRRVASGSGVATFHMPPTPAPSASSSPEARNKAAGPKTVASIAIRADRLEYFDEGREADYRGHVEVTNADTTLRAEHVQVYFSSPVQVPGRPAQRAQLERAVATGEVTVTQPGRRAAGNRAEYFAGTGRVVMTGGPPWVYDERNGFTTGQSLTFSIADDNLLVDGDKASPTLSKVPDAVMGHADSLHGRPH